MIGKYVVVKDAGTRQVFRMVRKNKKTVRVMDKYGRRKTFESYQVTPPFTFESAVGLRDRLIEHDKYARDAEIHFHDSLKLKEIRIIALNALRP